MAGKGTSKSHEPGKGDDAAFHPFSIKLSPVSRPSAAVGAPAAASSPNSSSGAGAPDGKEKTATPDTEAEPFLAEWLKPPKKNRSLAKWLEIVRPNLAKQQSHEETVKKNAEMAKASSPAAAAAAAPPLPHRFIVDRNTLIGEAPLTERVSDTVARFILSMYIREPGKPDRPLDLDKTWEQNNFDPTKSWWCVGTSLEED